MLPGAHRAYRAGGSDTHADAGQFLRVDPNRAVQNPDARGAEQIAKTNEGFDAGSVPVLGAVSLLFL
ncbi:hypothetical protein ACO3_590162 [Thiomonas arsenitoxydans]|nr:hypothetical protein ACO3_590162 [Thiomonas arsenitoxydans]